MSRTHFKAAALVSLLSLGQSVAYSQAPGPLRVSFTPAAIRPGDVVRVEIGDAGKDEVLSASVLGQDLSLELDERGRTWRALLGVDLGVAPGAYTMVIQRGGTTPPSTRTVRVVPRRFRERRLTVSREFVEPPPETLERIARESRTLSGIYAGVTPRQWRGAFLLPVNGKPSSNFGTRSFFNGEPRAPHAGVDFSGGTGTPVRAPNHGTVVLAAPLYFTGNTIVVDHGARLFSIFAHLSRLHVETGDAVEPRAVVGLVGATGRVTGPHLHWSVRLNGARVDPLSLVAATKE